MCSFNVDISEIEKHCVWRRHNLVPIYRGLGLPSFYLSVTTSAVLLALLLALPVHWGLSVRRCCRQCWWQTPLATGTRQEVVQRSRERFFLYCHSQSLAWNPSVCSRLIKAALQSCISETETVCSLRHSLTTSLMTEVKTMHWYESILFILDWWDWRICHFWQKNPFHFMLIILFCLGAL